ncbi:MAG: ATP-binding protein [Treponemataceae bacterium]|nr:ATP-binding protein [Treponemataceae bacterium]
MRTFIERALKKLPRMNQEQITALLLSIAEENERLETVLDSLAEGLLVCDTAGNLILLNKSAERLLPLIFHEQGERPLWLAIGDEGIAEFLKKTLTEGDRVLDREFDVEVKGIHRLLAISVLPLVKDRRVTGSLVHVEDITEKRAKEAQLRRAENLASLTTLAAGVAHEIKNPLGSISIHIQLIQKALKASKAACLEPQEEEERKTDSSSASLSPSREAPPMAPFDLLEKYLAVVNEEIDRLNRIVVDFLFAVRPMDMELREGNLNELIKELIAFVQYELEQNKITPKLELDKDLPLLTYDERYIKQALLNLIKNAIAAMPEGGTLTIQTQSCGSEVHVSVIDTGIGIPEEYISKIFEPYFTTKETGSGLGLTLVFKIIKEHQGEITVHSKEGEGTTFTIILPVPQKERRLIAYEGGTS